MVRERCVLVVEDGPSITHGGMPYGAGFVAATEAQAAQIIDPRGSAVDEIAAVLSSTLTLLRFCPRSVCRPCRLTRYQIVH